MNKVALQFLVLLSLLSGLVSGQNTHSPQQRAEASSLELPSLSIFGLSPRAVPKGFDNPFTAAELERFLVEIEKAKDENTKAEKERSYWIIPMVFYKSRNLFSKETWSVEEIKQGKQISNFFAKLADKPDLNIEGSDQESFRQGLVRLRDWFASLCSDNNTLALMIFTLNDGPFFGVEIAVKDYPKMRVVESAPIPGKQASFALMTDGSMPEPVVLGVLNEDKSVRWLKRFSNSPQGKITEAELQNPAIYRIEGYGYAVALMTEGTSGREHSYVYLDDALNLRFYYVSW